jgi:hypothetical protein
MSTVAPLFKWFLISPADKTDTKLLPVITDTLNFIPPASPEAVCFLRGDDGDIIRAVGDEGESPPVIELLLGAASSTSTLGKFTEETAACTPAAMPTNRRALARSWSSAMFLRSFLEDSLPKVLY